MRTAIPILLLLIFSLTDLFNQESIKISPTKYHFERFMALQTPTAPEVDSLIELSVAYSFTNEDSCLILGERALELSKKISNDGMHAKALLELGDSYRIFGRLKEGEQMLQEGRTIYEKLGDKGQIATANNKLGALNVNQGNYDIAITYYLDALKTWQDLKDSQNIIKPYINIGAVFKNLGQLDKAEQYYDDAIEWAEILDDNRAKMYVFNNRAIVYDDRIRNFQAQAEADTASTLIMDSIAIYIEKAENNLLSGLALANDIKDDRAALQLLGNLVGLKSNVGQYTEAIKFSKLDLLYL